MADTTTNATLTDVRDAIRIALEYVAYVLADEDLKDVRVEETEFFPSNGAWAITVGLSRSWNSPRTRAQEVLDEIGASSSHRRAFKVVTIAENGQVISMKDRRE